MFVDLGLIRRLAAQEAPSLGRPFVRRGRHGRIVAAVLTDPRFLRGAHRRRGRVRVALLPLGPPEQGVDCRNGRGHETDADLHVGEEGDQRVVPGDVDGAHPDDEGGHADEGTDDGDGADGDEDPEAQFPREGHFELPDDGDGKGPDDQVFEGAPRAVEAVEGEDVEAFVTLERV